MKSVSPSAASIDSATTEKAVRPQVLVIDDDPEIRTILQRALSRSGLGVTTATDGRSGLAMASTLRPDLIMLDVMMPGQSGLLVCEQLRRISPTTTRILLLTAAPTEANFELGRQAGADGFLAKPVRLSVLTEQVHRMLDHSPAVFESWSAVTGAVE